MAATKAKIDRANDREDLAVARLSDAGRDWLVAQLEMLGYAAWADLARREPRRGS